jgi:2,4-dienoyl-CoA reductase-like NADH-dependent reductase (Old Yellow Enzyme family)
MTRMRIILELPKPVRHRIDAEGIVVRCDPEDVGDDHFKVAILFTKVDDRDHEAIRKFVDHDLSQPDDDE